MWALPFPIIETQSPSPSQVVPVEEIQFGSYVYDIAPHSDSGATSNADEVKDCSCEGRTVIYNGTPGLI